MHFSTHHAKLYILMDFMNLSLIAHLFAVIKRESTFRISMIKAHSAEYALETAANAKQTKRSNPHTNCVHTPAAFSKPIYFHNLPCQRCVFVLNESNRRVLKIENVDELYFKKIESI